MLLALIITVYVVLGSVLAFFGDRYTFAHDSDPELRGFMFFMITASWPVVLVMSCVVGVGKLLEKVND